MEQEQKTGDGTLDSWLDAMTTLVESTQDTKIKNPIQQVNCYLNFFCHVVVIYRILINSFEF